MHYQNIRSCFYMLICALMLTACGGEQDVVNNQSMRVFAAAPAFSSSSFPRSRNSYTLVKTSAETIVTDRANGQQVSLSPTINTLQFSDARLNLSIAERAQQLSFNDLNRIIELYIAFFNRTPDADGLAYWIDQFSAGQSMESIANNFYNAAIIYSAQTGYSTTMSNESFVRIIYQNVLARTGTTAPTETELNYWTSELNSGTVTRGGLVISMLTSAHTFEGDASYGWVPQLLNNKIVVANYFCVQQGMNYLTPETSITQGMAIAAAVTPTDTSAALALIGLNDSGFNLVNAAPNQVSIVKLNAIPNPTGIKFGFWEVFNQQNATLTTMGKRPTSRVGFDSWSAIETSKGQFDFTAFNVSNSAQNYARAHHYGESIYAAVNISFSSLITPGKQTIPSFYTPNITDPVTRQAAKNFLRAYVQQMLKLLGNITLTIDYEIVSNYRLSAPGSETRASEWADWYVEAVAVARLAAADLGMTDQLKLQPIVNGNPFEPTNPISRGRASNHWLERVVAVSDSLALDTYYSDPSLEAANPKRTFDIIQFWIDQFSAGKDVVVTENGFNTVTEVIPSITRADRNWKTTGTEQEQAEYYSRLFAQLAEANKATGIFHNQLKSFNIWSITDNATKPTTDEDRYFGLVRVDGSEKPAAAVVRNALRQYETDPTTRPSNLTGLGLDVSKNFNSTPALPVSLQYKNGDQFEFLRYTETHLKYAQQYTLMLTLNNAASLIICVNGTQCLYQEEKVNFNIDLSSYLKPGESNTIDIYATSGVFPTLVNVKNLSLKKT